MSQYAPTFNDSRLATVWAIVESHRSGSALIVVASATSFDATQSVARGLCEAAYDAGNRTAYLYLGSSARSPAANSAAYADLSLPKTTSARQALDAALPGWRSDYDVIIVDLPEFTKSHVGAHIARIADGAVVALYVGRRISPADRDLKSLLTQLRTPIVGVVSTSRRESENDARRTPAATVRAISLPVRQR